MAQEALWHRCTVVCLQDRLVQEAGITAMICLQSDICHDALQIECVIPSIFQYLHSWTQGISSSLARINAMWVMIVLTAFIRACVFTRNVCCAAGKPYGCGRLSGRC